MAYSLNTLLKEGNYDELATLANMQKSVPSLFSSYVHDPS